MDQLISEMTLKDVFRCSKLSIKVSK